MWQLQPAGGAEHVSIAPQTRHNLLVELPAKHKQTINTYVSWSLLVYEEPEARRELELVSSSCS